MSIMRNKWVTGSVAAAVAALGLVATSASADARNCYRWNGGYCADWGYNNYNNNANAAAAIGAFASVMGAAVQASQPRYYYPPAPAYGYYAPPPAYGYYAAPPPPAYYGPEPVYGWR